MNIVFALILAWIMGWQIRNFFFAGDAKGLHPGPTPPSALFVFGSAAASVALLVYAIAEACVWVNMHLSFH